VPRPRTSETADRIRAAALEVIAEKGFQQASLREIAERVGITKPALYYHFTSREDLVRSLVQPLVDDVEELLDELESGRWPGDLSDKRAVLGAYFDVTYRNRGITKMVMQDPSVLAHLDLVTSVDAWRRRFEALLVGPAPTLSQQTRVAVAIGGLGDCTVMFADVPQPALKTAVLDAVCATLALP